MVKGIEGVRARGLFMQPVPPCWYQTGARGEYCVHSSCFSCVQRTLISPLLFSLTSQSLSLVSGGNRENKICLSVWVSSSMMLGGKEWCYREDKTGRVESGVETKVWERDGKFNRQGEGLWSEVLSLSRKSVLKLIHLDSTLGLDSTMIFKMIIICQPELFYLIHTAMYHRFVCV